MLESLISFFQKHQTIFLTLHILGVALGLGGATISDILFFKFLKDYRISKKEEEVLHILKTIVLGAIALLILSGIAVYLTDIPRYNQSAQFLVKALVVGVVTLNGIALHLYVAPHLIHLNLKDHKKMGRKWHKLAFGLGGVSVASWYSAFFIAMLKSIIPWSFWTLLLIYFTVLVAGVCMSQVLENYLTKRARKRKEIQKD